MATKYYTGGAITNQKVLRLVKGSGAGNLSGSVISLGLGNRLITNTGWNVNALQQKWAAITDSDFTDITCTVSGNDLVFTHNTPGEDFEITVLVDGELAFVSSTVQTITITRATGGIFTLKAFAGTGSEETTGSITFNPAAPSTTASNIRTALEALTAFQSGDIVVTGSDDGRTYTISFGGQYLNMSVQTLTANGSGLTGGNSSVTVSSITNYQTAQAEIQSISFSVQQTVSPQPEKQSISLTGATGGTFTLTYSGQTTSAIPYNASASAIQTALEALSNINPGDIVCSGGPLPQKTVYVTWTDTTNHSQMTANSSSLVGNTSNLLVSTVQQGAAPSAILKLGFKTTSSISSPVACFAKLINGGNSIVNLTSFQSNDSHSAIKAAICDYFNSYVPLTLPTTTYVPGITGGIPFGPNDITVAGTLGNTGDGLTIEFGHSVAQFWDRTNNGFVFNGKLFTMELAVTGYTCNTTVLVEHDATTHKIETQTIAPVGIVPTSGTYNLDYDGTNTANINLAGGSLSGGYIAKLINDAIPNTDAPQYAKVYVTSRDSSYHNVLDGDTIAIPTDASALQTALGDGSYSISYISVHLPFDTTGFTHFTYGQGSVSGISFDWSAAATAINNFVSSYNTGLKAVVRGTGDIIFNPPSGSISIDFIGGNSLVWNNCVQLAIEGGSTPAVGISTLVNGGDTLITGVTGGFYAILIDGIQINDIPYNVSASQLQTIINNKLGAGTVSCSGGPHPNTAIVITWTTTGPHDPIVVAPSFSGTIPGTCSVSNLSLGVRPKTSNTYDLVVIPGEHTLAVSASARFDMTIVSSLGSQTLSLPIKSLSPELLENTINELFAEEVVSVVKTSHTLEHGNVQSEPYGAGTLVYNFWYYRDMYQIRFVNRFADESSITSVTVSNPTYSVVFSPSGDSTDPADQFYESQRTYIGFQEAYNNNKPLNIISIVKSGVQSGTTYDFYCMLETQYATTSMAGVGYRGIGAILADSKIKFRWCGVNPFMGDSGGSVVTKDYKVLLESAPISWDSSPEAIKEAIGNMADLTVTGPFPTSKLFGIDNVEVTGSLRNSWLSYADPNYSSLRIKIGGIWDGQPWYYERLELRMVLLPVKYDWFGPSTGLQSDPANPTTSAYTCVAGKAIPPFSNARIRAVPYSTSTDIIFRYKSYTQNISHSTSQANIQSSIDSMMGYALVTGAQFDADTGYPSNDQGFALPSRFARACYVFGSVSSGALEFEMTGAGYQGLALAPAISGNQSGIWTVSTSQDGRNATTEVQRLSIISSESSPAPTGGTFTLTRGSYTTSSLNFDATASQVQTALRALTSVGSTGVTCSGGPLPGSPIDCSFDSGLGDIATMTATSSLSNGSINITNTKSGGIDGGLQFYEDTKGAGPAYFDHPDNWTDRTLPSSQDTIVVDQVNSPIKYGLRQKVNFIVVDTSDKGIFLLTSPRKTFENGQKVYVRSTNTLPSGLTTGYYYIRNMSTRMTFSLSSTPTGSLISVSGHGSGTHSVELRELSLQVYARYAGREFGLQRVRSGGVQEHLCEYLTAGFTSIELGIDTGDGLTLGRFDTLDQSCEIVCNQTGSSSVDNIPAVLLETDNTNTTIVATDSELGVSVYSDQSSNLKSVELTGSSSSMLICNSTVQGTVKTKAGASVTLKRTTVGSFIDEA